MSTSPGDPARLAVAYEVYRPLVVGVVSWQVRGADRHMVEDLAQVTFLRAWPYLHTVRNPQVLDGWLAAIARHVVADHYRNRSHRPGGRSVTEAPMVPDSQVWSTCAPTTEPTEDAVTARVDLARALAELPPATQRVLQLRVVDELPWRVVATRMHRGKTAVRQLAGEDLEALRGRLADTDGPAAQAPAPWPGDPRMRTRITAGEERRQVASLARHVLVDTSHRIAHQDVNTAAEGRLRAAVADLPADTRQVLELRFAQGLPVRQVAAQLGCSRQIVCSRIAHGLVALRAQLSEPTPPAAAAGAAGWRGPVGARA